MTLRLAVWSGPRNISTAFMRAWENRGDAAVVDEPFYAHYLAVTGLDHPVADAVMASQPTDWRDVVTQLTGPVPGDKAIYYQKQMAHHLLPEIGREWLGALTHAFLIREPKAMLLSLEQKLGGIVLTDTGLPQQAEIFDFVLEQTGDVPCVVDSRDLLHDPATILSELCRRLGVEYTDRMLHWPAGRRDSDGVWAEHWYDSVERSTGFGPYRPKTGELSPALAALERECRPFYEQLYEHRITA